MSQAGKQQLVEPQGERHQHTLRLAPSAQDLGPHHPPRTGTVCGLTQRIAGD